MITILVSFLSTILPKPNTPASLSMSSSITSPCHVKAPLLPSNYVIPATLLPSCLSQ
jgi:hypothetical protein